MSTMNPAYTRLAIVFHWIAVVGIFGTFALGVYMSDLDLSPTKLRLYSWHKWIGVSLFLLVLIRIGWRIRYPPPPFPTHMQTLERLAANAGHLALYVLMVAIPLSGWLMSSAKGFQTVWFGVIPLPDLIEKNAALGDALLTLHEVMNYTLLVMVVIHVAAALKHHFVDRDDVMVRMIPLLRMRRPAGAKESEEK